MSIGLKHTGKQLDDRKEVKYADVVEAKLSDNDFDFMRKDRGDTAIFFLPMHADNAPGLNIRLIIDENGDSQFRCYIAENVPEKKRADVIDECNHVNSEFRYISLSVDDDGDVCATYDFAIFGDEEVTAEHAISMIFLCADITDKCIPCIMKRLWREESQNSGQPHIKMDLFQSEGGEA